MFDRNHKPSECVLGEFYIHSMLLNHLSAFISLVWEEFWPRPSERKLVELDFVCMHFV